MRPGAKRSRQEERAERRRNELCIGLSVRAEGSSGVLNRLCEPLAQAKEDAGQDLVCAALHQRLPRSFGDRRLQKRHSRPDVVVVRTDAGQDDECAGALGTRGELRNGLVEQLRARRASPASKR